MELSEDMLKRIASEITELRLQFGLMREVVIQLGAKPGELDRIMNEVLHGPVFQQAHALVLEKLRGGH
jgi:hypothetical protein